MNLAWLTDIHLNFLDKIERVEFYQTLLKTKFDAVLITGDIAEAPSIANILKEMADHIQKPIYFVLGNHDYYRGQIDAVRNEMIALTKNEKLLHWLPASGPQYLEKNVALLGQDGWADGRIGDYEHSRVVLNDSRMIADLYQHSVLGRTPLLKKMKQLADDDAQNLQHDLEQVLKKNPKKIIVLTHVPPFKESCMHEGKISDDDWLPFFSSKATGDVLIKFANENPEIEFLVLCGHTHSPSRFQATKNMLVEAGKAKYFEPATQSIITIP